MPTSRMVDNDWQAQISEKVNLLETKMISMDNGLAGAGENIKKILDYLMKNSAGGTTPPRKKQSRGPPLSPLNENQRSAISEIARAQRPMVDHMSPKGHTHIYSRRGGVGREGEDDETDGFENEVVDLGDEDPYIIPSTQFRKGNGKSGIDKGIVIIDSQSGGEDPDTEYRGALLEEFQRRRPQEVEGEKERGKKSKGAPLAGIRRLEKSSNVEDVAQKTKSQKLMYNRSEEEEDDSDTETLSLPGRSEKKNSGAPSTLTYRRTKNSENAPSTEPSRAVGVAATEVPGTLRPRKNGVSSDAMLLFPSFGCLDQRNSEICYIVGMCFGLHDHRKDENSSGISLQHVYVYELGSCVHVQVPLRFNTQCWMLHPDFPGKVVAAGRAGVYGRSRAKKHKDLSDQCENGNQMVQVTDVFLPLVPVMYEEERHGLQTLDEVAVPHAPRDTWLKWESNYMIEKPRTY